VIDGPDKNFEAYMDEETGEYVYDAFNYTAHGRLAEDWKAYPMPLAVWDLGVAVWNIALPFLRGHSATVPPNACQLCAYYTLFGGAIQRHRDNFTTEQMIARLEKNDNDVQPFHGQPPWWRCKFTSVGFVRVSVYLRRRGNGLQVVLPAANRSQRKSKRIQGSPPVHREAVTRHIVHFLSGGRRLLLPRGCVSAGRRWIPPCFRVSVAFICAAVLSEH
jgi:hypothetical protein